MTNSEGARSERGGSDFLNALQSAARENPLSAALIGMGVLWLFMGGAETSLFGGGGRKSIFRVAAKNAEGVAATGSAAGAHLGSATSRAYDAVADAASHLTDAVRHASIAAGDTASQAASQTAETVAGAYNTTKDRAALAVASISEASTSAAGALQEQGAKWGSVVQDNLSSLFDRQPLLLAGVGIAIGAGIGASIPITEAEKKMIGAAADLLPQTETTAQIGEAAHAALQEVKAQGLTPHAVGEAFREVGDKIGSARYPGA